MKTVGAFEAKTHFSKLLRDVENGEDILITRQKEPVARLIGVCAQELVNAREAVENIKRLRRSVSDDSHIDTRDLVIEGRRF